MALLAKKEVDCWPSGDGVRGEMGREEIGWSIFFISAIEQMDMEVNGGEIGRVKNFKMVVK